MVQVEKEFSLICPYCGYGHAVNEGSSFFENGICTITCVLCSQEYCYEENPVFKQEFPDFSLVAGVFIPDDFSDESWHNDICPSFRKDYADGGRCVLWMDYEPITKRISENAKRFTVYFYRSENDTCDGHYLSYESEDFEETLRFIHSVETGNLYRR